MNEIYNKLRDYCTKNGTTITKLCVDITGSKGNLKTWKTGSIRNDYLIKIAKYFNVSADYLLGLSETPVPLNCLSENERLIINKYKENPELLPLIDLYSSLPEKDKGIILGRLEVMAEQTKSSINCLK